MSVASDLPIPIADGTLKSASHAPLVRLLPWFGLATVVLSDMPVFDQTLGGNIVRYALLALALIGIAYNSSIIAERMRTEETVLIALYGFFLFIAALFGVFSGVDPEPRELLRSIVPFLIVYLSAKCFASPQDIERWWKFFYILGIVASLQALAAVALDMIGLRHLFSIQLRMDAGGRYFLEWAGLLGGSSLNFRTDFYFSESSYFAHMLMPAIIYAAVTGRIAGLVILLLGFLTTLSGFASIALALSLAFLLVCIGIDIWITMCFAVIVILGLIVYARISQNVMLATLLLDRSDSISGKVSIINFSLVHLGRFPFGIGPVNIPFYYPNINTANGVFIIIAQLGFPGLFLLSVTAFYLIFLVFRRGESRFIKMMALAIGGTMLAGFSHGPIYKYYLIFMLSALFLYRDWTLLFATRGPTAPKSSMSVAIPERGPGAAL